MFDQRSAYEYAYEPDTEVVDEPIPPPLRARTSTDGALTMQVYKIDSWHRRTPDLATTACGIPIHSQFDAVRREALNKTLCRECFTAFEIDRAYTNNAKEEEY